MALPYNTLAWIFPLFLVLAVYCIIHCWRSRRTLAWILVAVTILSIGAMAALAYFQTQP